MATRQQLLKSGMPALLSHLLGTDGRNGATMVELMVGGGMTAQLAKLLATDKPPPSGTPQMRVLVWAKMPWNQAELLGVPP